MNKKELRSSVRALKRAMTEEEIVAKSEKLGELFVSTPGLPVHHQLLEFTQTHVH